MRHEYTWKIGMEFTTNRQLQVDRPVFEGAVLVDLLTGDRYLVERMYDARLEEKFVSIMPDRAIRTRAVEPLSTEDLDKLRTRAGYVPDSNCQPFGNLVFETEAKVAA
jgi:hypothetical protein